SDGASPPSTADAAAAAMGLKILSEHPEMRRQLWENVSYLRRGLKEMGVVTEDTPVPIISLQLPEVDLMGVYAGLNEEDIVVAYIPPRGYSDAPEIESLKITLFSTHTREQLGRLLDVLRRLL
ncbi:aminotransferase class I/II-fold pyridoxal phosphate-dependent enzyme, partial [Candidatus Bipolaricaulota bacterium]|nr:aminotransferase class I/II-fold pyridoxal phosphate-dependent enzyme [Candidatus Bipolaricaulota bacterium]